MIVDRHVICHSHFMLLLIDFSLYQNILQVFWILFLKQPFCSLYKWALPSHKDIRDNFICICDYIDYILYSNLFNKSISIIAFKASLLWFFEQKVVKPCLYILKQVILTSQKINKKIIKFQMKWFTHRNPSNMQSLKIITTSAKKSKKLFLSNNYDEL